MVEISSLGIFFISDNIFHVFSIGRHFQHINQASTQKDRSKHFNKALKIFLILVFRLFSRKRHRFLNAWFSFLPMFSSNKVFFIISFIVRRWVIKTNSRFYFYIIIWLSINMNIFIIIIIIIITRWILPDCVSTSEIETSL